MPRLLVYLLPLLFVLSAIAQTPQKFPNGLIYDSEVIGRMHSKADSMSSVFNTLPAATPPQSLPQGYAHAVEIKHKIRAAKADMDKAMPYDQLVRKYKLDSTQAEKNLLVVSGAVFYAEGEVRFYDVYPSIDSLIDLKNLKLTEHWVYMIEDHTLKAFYFITDLKTQPIPPHYTRWIQYYNFMVDTTTVLPCKPMPDTAGKINKIKAFWDYTYNYPNMPVQGTEDWNTHRRKFTAWNEARMEWVDSVLAPTAKFKTMLTDAVEYAVVHCIGNDELEDNALKYLGPAMALKIALKKEIRVNNMYPDPPRYAYWRLATLAAKAGNFKVFLQKHLRAMDYWCPGNYQRCREEEIYIKEPELLGIDMVPLLLATILKTGTPIPIGNYYNILFPVRPLAQSSNPQAVVDSLLIMLKDNSLDPYNRLQTLNICLWYIDEIEDKNSKVQFLNDVKEAVKTFPVLLQPKLTKQLAEFKPRKNPE